MTGTWLCIYCVLIGILIPNAESSDSSNNAMPAGITITNYEQLKRIEVSKVTNTTSSLSTPTVLQQGDNVFIKPKFILNSPYTSNKKGYKPAERFSRISKVSGAELNTVIVKSEVPQLPTFVVPPPAAMNIPMQAAGDISITCARIPCPPQVTLTPNFPQFVRFPIVVEKPLRPVIIPEPPKLPPIVLPKLPIQVIVERPKIPIPTHHVIVQSLCPPTSKCIPTDDMPTVPEVFSGMFQRFQNILTVSNQINVPKASVTDELTVTHDLPLAFPTLCAHEIIAERVVPNIVTNEDVKVFMSPVFPSQLERVQFYRK